MPRGAVKFLVVLNLAVAVLLGGNKFLWVDVERREDVIDVLLAEGRKLWKLIVSETPPPVEPWSDTASDLLEALYAKEDGTTIELPAEALGWDARRSELKAQAKTVAEEVTALDNRIKASIGGATVGTLPDGSGRYRWAHVTRHMPAREAYDTSFRELRRLAPLKGSDTRGQRARSEVPTEEDR